MATQRRPTTSKRTKQKKTARPAPAREPLRELYLAGLGAVATAGEGAQSAFDVLVARGRQREPKLVAAANRAVRDARGAVGDLAEEAGRRSMELFDEALERIGQRPRPRERNILHRLGDLAEALL